jgi:hypothetical protein
MPHNKQSHSHSHSHSHHKHPEPSYIIKYNRDKINNCKINLDCKRKYCEHSADLKYDHNCCTFKNGEKQYRECESTSYNSTCGIDSAYLLKYCVPQVFDTDSQSQIITQINKARIDSRNVDTNFENKRYSLFCDYDYRAKLEKKIACDVLHKRTTTTDDANDEDESHCQNTNFSFEMPNSMRYNMTAKQPFVSASADVFDVYPDISSEYPVMVRRPEDYKQTYSVY